MIKKGRADKEEKMRKLLVLVMTGCFAGCLWAADCVLLGKEPAFIVQFKTKESAHLFRANPLSLSGFKFLQMRRLAQDQHLLIFQPLSDHPVCYAPAEVQAFVALLLNNPEINTVMPNLIMKPFSEPHALQWHLKSAPAGIEIAQAWKLLNKQGDKTTTVAVLDTGILDNMSLNPNLLQARFNGKEYLWQPGVMHGEDAGLSFTDNGRSWALGANPSCLKCPATAHGTHVAGIIAASGELAYGEQVYGVAPKNTLLPINVFSLINDQDICDGYKNTPCIISYTADQLNAQAWLAGVKFSGLPLAPKIAVMNISLGGLGECPRLAQESFNRLLQKNMSIVVASGNSNLSADKIYPASCPQVITVAATGPSGERAWYSNWGARVNIAAPGGNSLNPLYSTPQNQIYSTIAHAYKFMQGTSMAAPTVAGVLALMYSYQPKLDQAILLSMLADGKNNSAFAAEEALPANLISCINKQRPNQTCGAGIINAAKLAQAVMHLNL